MGRGRAKAKQTRVARELKYHSPNTDIAALQRELAGSPKSDDVDDGYDGYDADDDDDDPSDDDDSENDDTAAGPARRR